MVHLGPINNMSKVERALLRDKVLFRILKTKGDNVCSICEKLEYNIRNVQILSDEEICELWCQIKLILVDAKKICDQSQNENKYSKEYDMMLKLIDTIARMALETTLRRKFIPNKLLEVVIILHSVMLQKLKNDQVKDKISLLLENWWRLDQIWKEKLIVNALKYLIDKAQTSRMYYLKRLNALKSAFCLLDGPTDIQILLQLARDEKIVSTKEGKELLSCLFTMEEEWIKAIHNHIKITLETAKRNSVQGYAEIYAKAWLDVSLQEKRIIIENCLQNIIFHYLRVNRTSADQAKLRENLFVFLSDLHKHKDITVKRMIFSHYKALLWKHLKAPGSCIRCNAADILFAAYPMQNTLPANKNVTAHLQKQYNAMTDLLKDSDPDVCCAAIKGISRILQDHCNRIPQNIIKEWFDALLDCTRRFNSPRVIMAMNDCIKRVASNTELLHSLKNILSKFITTVHKTNETIMEGFIHCLLDAKHSVNVPLSELVPIPLILDHMESTEDKTQLELLVQFLWRHILSNNSKKQTSLQKVIHIGRCNIKALRRLLFHSVSAIDWHTSLQLIKNAWSIIEKLGYSPGSCKRPKLESASEKYDPDDFYVLLDVITLLLAMSQKHLLDDHLTDETEDIIRALANKLPSLYDSLKHTPMRESVIFLLSVIPTRFLSDETMIVNIFLKELKCYSVTDNTIFTVIQALSEWEKIDTMLDLLGELLPSDIGEEIHNNNQENIDKANAGKSLELALRILKHLLNNKHRANIITKYHKDICSFWQKLHVLKYLVEETFCKKGTADTVVSENVTLDFFEQYVTMISLLHKTGEFDAPKQFSEILIWSRRKIVCNVPSIGNTETNSFCLRLIKVLLNASDTMLMCAQVTPKTCCDIVHFHCDYISSPGGVIFISEILNSMKHLLDFGRTAYDNGDDSLLISVIPKLLFVILTNLSNCSSDCVTAYTNNLKKLPAALHKYFTVIECTFKDPKMHISLTTITLNAAIRCINKELKGVLPDICDESTKILDMKFPFLVEKILQIILYTKKYQEFCIEVLADAAVTYTNADKLSTLLIIYHLVKSPTKLRPSSFKKIRKAAIISKEENKRKLNSATSDKSMDDAQEVVLDAICEKIRLTEP